MNCNFHGVLMCHLNTLLKFIIYFIVFLLKISLFVNYAVIFFVKPPQFFIRSLNVGP